MEEKKVEYISKQALLDKTVNKNHAWLYTTNAEGKNLKEIVDELLPADVRPNVHGHWKLVHPLQSDDGGAYVCSVCGTGDWGIDPRYWKGCPWCLAIMDGEPIGEKGTE